MKTFRVLLILIVVFHCSLLQVDAQNTEREIDSLSRVAQNAPDSLKYDIYNRMGFHYIFNDRKRADSILRRAIKSSKEIDYKYGTVLLTNTYGISFDVNREYDSAFYYFEKARNLSKEYDFKVLETRSLNNLGMNAWGQDKLNEAQEFFFEALTQTKEHFPEKRTDVYLSNIGLIYQELEQTEKALDYHERALEERIKRNLKTQQIISYNNIGITHRLMKAYTKAIEAFDRGLEIAEEIQFYTEYQRLFISKADAQISMGNYPEAIKSYENSKKGPPDNNIDIRTYFEAVSGLSYAYFLNNNNQKAQENLEEGFELLNEYPSFTDSAGFFYKTASSIYLADGNKEQGIRFVDSLQAVLKRKFSQENARAIALSETRFNTAEKEVALAETRASLAERELEVRQRNNIIYGVIGITLLLGLIGYFLYNQQRLKNEQLKKESKLKEALSKIETQNHLQEQRLRISRDLHDNIGSQLTFIISSLDNLKYGLKEADSVVKTKLGEVGDFTKNTINELRDTIWAMNKESISLEDIEARIANLLEQARTACPETTFVLDFQKDIDRNQSLTSVEGVTIYRVIQEAINNAIKYAKADHIEVSLSKDQNRLSASVKDNGKGFDFRNPEIGNGLLNMKKRAKGITASYKIFSEENKGTSVSMTLDMKK